MYLLSYCRATMAHNFYIESLALTSTTYVAACNNLVPVITLIIAVCFRYLYTEVIKPRFQV